MLHYTSEYLLRPNHRINVYLVGVGGTGSQILNGLARLDYALRDFGHPGLNVTSYDPGEVRKANIGRQLFSPLDIGENKARILTERINNFFGLDWNSLPFEFGFDDNAPIELPEILITAVDKGKVRKEIWEGISKLYERTTYHHEDPDPIYWLDTGNSKKTGQVILGTWGKIAAPDDVEENECQQDLPTILDFFPDIEHEDQLDDTPSCSLAESLRSQGLFINTGIATFALDLLWKLFDDGKIVSQGAYINLGTTKVLPIEIKKAHLLEEKAA